MFNIRWDVALIPFRFYSHSIPFYSHIDPIFLFAVSLWRPLLRIPRLEEYIETRGAILYRGCTKAADKANAAKRSGCWRGGR